jgi:hypothetical protein
MEFFKIPLVCIVAAAIYGIVHDQVTARICLEYFTVFHPRIFPTESPTLLAIGWGIVATWWMGALLGLLLAVAARAGSRPKLTAREVFPYIVRLLVVMAVCAFVSGLVGFSLARRGVVSPADFIVRTPSINVSNFMADWYAHSASYASGFFGGLAVCVLVYRKRALLGRALKREIVST